MYKTIRDSEQPTLIVTNPEVHWISPTESGAAVPGQTVSPPALTPHTTPPGALGPVSPGPPVPFRKIIYLVFSTLIGRSPTM